MTISSERMPLASLDAERRPSRSTGVRRGGLSAREFAERFQDSARVLWTVAAGILGDRSQVDDVLQEAAVIALGKLHRFEPGTSFTAWMCQVVRNVARNLARKERRRATTPMDPEALSRVLSGPDPTPGAARGGVDGVGSRAGGGAVGPRGELLPDAGDFDDRIVRALQGLEPTARAALLLRTVLLLEYREISALLGIPEGTAMSHVHRSRMTLRRRLGQLDSLETASKARLQLERGA
ncbi:MAG: RNA polymerase sigma factor [Planctomycetota bacterium]|nr:RNA polymerase sigma factor [Planctomycetota bacterium]